MPITTCQHIKPDGIPCGSPALKWKRFCYFHDRDRKQTARMTAEQKRQRWFESLRLDDPKVINMAIIKTAQGMLEGEIDDKLAGQMLFKLNLAIAAFPKSNETEATHRIEYPGLVRPRRR